MNLTKIESAGVRAAILRDTFDFISFWEAVDENGLLYEIGDLYNHFLYLKSDATTPAEHFEYFMRYHCTA